MYNSETDRKFKWFLRDKFVSFYDLIDECIGSLSLYIYMYVLNDIR